MKLAEQSEKGSHYAAETERYKWTLGFLGLERPRCALCSGWRCTLKALCISKWIYIPPHMFQTDFSLYWCIERMDLLFDTLSTYNVFRLKDNIWWN